MSISLGHRIQEARREAGFQNPETFAAALGVSPATVSRYEQGVVVPSVKRLAQIAALVGTTIGDLLTEEVAA